MQRPDPAKRREILEVATRLFAARRFHEVKLDEVAAGAGVGKGTLYVYFAGKEALYREVIHEALRRLHEELDDELARADGGAWERMGLLVRRTVSFVFRHPDLSELMRGGLLPSDPRLLAKRAELAAQVESVLRAGVESGEIVDARPELTAQYVLALLRVPLLHRPDDLEEDVLVEHMLAVLGQGLLRRPARSDGMP